MSRVWIRQAAPCQKQAAWLNINWNALHAKVKSLQNRIVQAVKQGAWRKVKRLQYLLTRSFAGRALAVKRVTENKGRKTAGIDGEVWQTPSQKIQAITTLANWKGYQPKALKRVQIPKKDKTQTRPLGIPTIEDRARQAVYTLALEPVAETLADKNSYGFRRKRRCADAIDQIFKVLRQKNSSQWILEGDIKGFFDNISFDWILQNIPVNQQIMSKWLNSGFIENGQFSNTTQGVPQGGIISPVIGNMVLDGLEALVMQTTRYQRKHGINFVRYADDFIVTAKTKEVLEQEIIPRINAFLAIRGVQLSEKKTKITHISAGFDFLGQTTRKYQHGEQLGKIQIEPSLASVASIKQKIQDIIQSSGQLTQAELIDRLNPVLRGWANYHRHIICGETYANIGNFVWFKLMRWAKSRHPEKSGRWIYQKYFTHANGSAWTFQDQSSGKTLVRLSFDIATYRHIKIRADANPFDINWQPYFAERELALQVKANSHYIGKVLKQQRGICPFCKQTLAAEDDYYLIYHDGNRRHQKVKNVAMLHEECKQGYEYTKDKRQAAAPNSFGAGHA